MQTGLTLLHNELQLDKFPNHSKPHKQSNQMPMHSFLTQLLSNLKQYLNSDFRYSWAQYIICNKNHQTNHLVRSWIAFSKTSLEAQLMSGLLICSDQRKCKLYVRLRKYIVQLMACNFLDQIALKHEDVITILHRMFPPSFKKQLMNGIKQIFLNYRVADPKIYSCVFIQYILSVYDTIDQTQKPIMIGESNTITNEAISNFSSINKFNSNLHKENGLYRKVGGNQNTYVIIQSKFLPQRLQKQKTKFEEEAYSSQYYSNSINFDDQSLINNHVLKNSQKQNVRANHTINSSSKKKKEDYIFIAKKSQIMIQDQNSSVHSQPTQIKSSIDSIKSAQRQILSLIQRNQAFKSRLLSGKSDARLQLSNQEQSSITGAINIIHNSIVRNRRQRL